MDQRLIREIIRGDEEYLRDESKKVGYAESISFPETEAQVCQIMAQLSKTGTPVTVQGSRTGLASAAVPFGGHVLNLSRMDKVLYHGSARCDSAEAEQIHCSPVLRQQGLG